MFFGPRITTVFASRWKALAWAIGVMISAYCWIPAAKEGQDASGADTSAADAASLMQAIGGGAAPANADPAKSPWSR